MDKSDFRRLYSVALEAAARDAEARLGRPVSRNFVIELHGLAPHPRLLPPEQVVDALYLGPDKFYRVVDVSVVRVGAARTVVFTRISGHPPAEFDKTWNTPPGAGPFKQTRATEITLE
jgi:hypothetical protein